MDGRVDAPRGWIVRLVVDFTHPSHLVTRPDGHGRESDRGLRDQRRNKIIELLVSVDSAARIRVPLALAHFGIETEEVIHRRRAPASHGTDRGRQYRVPAALHSCETCDL